MTNSDAPSEILRRLYYFHEKGELDGGSPTDIVSNMVAFGFFMAATTCSQAFEVTQELDFECDDTAKGDAVRLNANCIYCKTQVAKLMEDRRQLELTAKARNAAYIPQTASDALLKDISGELPDLSDGACKYVCLQCLARDISQTIHMRMNVECDIDTQPFFTAFSNGMTVAAEQTITQYQDKLASLGTQILSSNDVKRASIHMSDTVRNVTNVKVLNALKQSALVSQQMKIDKGSTSVVIQNVKQSISFTMMSSIASKIYSHVSVTNAIGYNAIYVKETDKLYSLRDLADDLAQSIDTMQQALTNSVVRIIMIITIMLIIAVLIFASLFFFKPDILFGGLGTYTQALAAK